LKFAFENKCLPSGQERNLKIIFLFPVALKSAVDRNKINISYQRMNAKVCRKERAFAAIIARAEKTEIALFHTLRARGCCNNVVGA
jgi:hypothetical protein